MPTIYYLNGSLSSEAAVNAALANLPGSWELNEGADDCDDCPTEPSTTLYYSSVWSTSDYSCDEGTAFGTRSYASFENYLETYVPEYVPNSLRVVDSNYQQVSVSGLYWDSCQEIQVYQSPTTWTTMRVSYEKYD
jgi:hypothetical protein